MENNVYEAPAAELKVKTEEFELASRWSRLGAVILDSLIIGAVTGPLMYFTGGVDDIVAGIEPSVLYNLGVGLAGVVVFIAVHGYFLVRDGQTIGKKALNIKIVTVDNELPSVPHLLRRYGFYMLIPNIPFVGPLLSIVNVLFIFGKKKRCLHDRVGDTKVVKAVPVAA